MTACQHFDDYLDNELSPEERSAFVTHLSDCSDCSRELAAQRRFNQMIAAVRNDTFRRDAAAMDHIQAEVRSRIRRIRVATATKAVAAMLLVGLGVWTIYARNNVSSRLAEPVADVPTVTPVEPDAIAASPKNRPDVQVEVADDADYLAVPVENSNPEITIIWFHPTIDSPKPEPSSSILLEPVDAIAQRT